MPKKATCRKHTYVKQPAQKGLDKKESRFQVPTIPKAPQIGFRPPACRCLFVRAYQTVTHSTQRTLRYSQWPSSKPCSNWGLVDRKDPAVAIVAKRIIALALKGEQTIIVLILQIAESRG